MGGEQLRQLGAGYIAAVQALAPDAKRITDKLPHNFRFAGLIHLALPNARLRARSDRLSQRGKTVSSERQKLWID